MNWRHDLSNKTPQQRAIIMKNDEEEKRGKKEVQSNAPQPATKNRKVLPTSIFMKLGNERTKQLKGIETLQLYEKFCKSRHSVWFSTDSLAKGMAETKRLKLINAIKNGFIVEMYFAVGKNSGGENQIIYRAEVLDIKTDSSGMSSPDKALTPDIWAEIHNKIWIKLKNIASQSKLTVEDFIVESSGNLLANSVSNSQYNFGYIKKRK